MSGAPLKLKAADMPDMPPLEGRLTFAIHRIAAQLARVANPIFNRFDLDLDTARILVILLGRKTMPVGELVQLMVLPQSTISHQLRRLEKRGLISRQRLASDQRAVAISLTAEGKKIAKEANTLSEDVHETILAGLDPEGHRALLGALGDIMERLNRFVPKNTD